MPPPPVRPPLVQRPRELNLQGCRMDAEGFRDFLEIAACNGLEALNARNCKSLGLPLLLVPWAVDSFAQKMLDRWPLHRVALGGGTYLNAEEQDTVLRAHHRVELDVRGINLNDWSHS